MLKLDLFAGPLAKFKICLAFTLLCVLAHGQTSNPTEPPKAKWTVMVFMDSDNNLEAAQMLNVNQALQAGGSEAVRIIMLVDRSPDYFEGGAYNLGDWDGGKFLEVKKDKVEVIEALNDINMGDPDELILFVNKAIERAPAEKYALIFADHGGSWPGFNGNGYDPNEIMTLNELTEALKVITKKHGRLELIHNDNCLMSCVEMATAVAPYTKWMTASAETMPGAGSDYDIFLRGLMKNPSMDGKGFGSLLIDSYKTAYSGKSNLRDGITLSLIDCDQVAPLVNKLNVLGNSLKSSLDRADEKALKMVAAANSNSIKYAKRADSVKDRGAVDLLDFCRKLQSNGLESIATAQAITDVLAQLKKAVVKTHNGEAFEFGGGLSINVTTDSEKLEGNGNSYANTLFAKQTGWDKFIKSFQSLRKGDTKKPTIADMIASIAALKPGAKMSLGASITAKDIDSAFFTLSLPAGDDLVRIGQLPCLIKENGKVESSFNGMWLYLSSDGQKGPICPISHVRNLEAGNPLGDLLAYVPLEVQKGSDGKWFTCTGVFAVDLSNEEVVTGNFLYGYKVTEIAAEQIQLEEGDSIRPIYVVLDKSGKETDTSSGGEDELKIGRDGGLAIRDDRLPSGDYFIGFRVTDFGGNIARSQVKVTLEDSKSSKNNQSGRK